MSNVYAIVLAGGSGARMNNAVPKQFLTIGDKPVIAYPLETCSSHPDVAGIIIAVHPDYLDSISTIISQYKIQKVLQIITGGDTRQMSVYNALTCREFLPDDIVLLHDAARPFVTRTIISNAVQAAQDYGAANVCVETTDTIIQLNQSGNIENVPPRAFLRNSQTPQAFQYAVIRSAHEHFLSGGEKETSDDVQMIHRLGKKVAMVNGSYDNFKITTQRDLEIAECIAQNFCAD